RRPAMLFAGGALLVCSVTKAVMPCEGSAVTLASLTSGSPARVSPATAGLEGTGAAPPEAFEPPEAAASSRASAAARAPAPPVLDARPPATRPRAVTRSEATPLAQTSTLVQTTVLPQAPAPLGASSSAQASIKPMRDLAVAHALVDRAQQAALHGRF